VTDELIERLTNLGHGFVREPLLVLGVEPEAVNRSPVTTLGYDTP
jgi:hypothetical protein